MDTAELRKSWEISLLALLLWREARNQSANAMMAVACSVRNRVLRPRWWGHDWISVILCGEQYSSFNRNDPNSTKFPPSADSIFPQCLAIAAAIHEGLQDDVIGGADSYHDTSIAPPEWTTKMEKVGNVGDFSFYRTPEAMSA
jgi:spore germination cell wall hydrolase CwlJ-like protein